MDFSNNWLAEPLGFGEALDHAANDLADRVVDGLSGAVREALQDPLVTAIMSADKVDPRAFADMLRRMSATIANPPNRPCYRC
ncbi:MAG TPA: hypothetical protein VL993_15165 [Stellaceae bacterium]|nr:hypothetical protein [Stellaceae bacterium]